MGLLFYKALTATRFISLNNDIAHHGIRFQLVMGNGVKDLTFADQVISMRRMLHSVQPDRTYRKFITMLSLYP